MSNDNKNYYEVLEISTNSSPQEIERAYTRAKNSYTGDSLALYSLLSANECKEILNQVEEAYSILGFPDKRREYDRARGINQNQSTSNTDQQSKNTFTHQPSHDLTESTFNSSTPFDVNYEKPTGFSYEDFGKNQNEAKVSKVTAIKKFQLEYNVDSAMEKKIEESLVFTGSFLKQIREYKNVSVERMVDLLKISKTYLNAIENDDFTKLPADVYARGFILQYAKCLKLNVDLVANSYIHNIKSLRAKK